MCLCPRFWQDNPDLIELCAFFMGTKPYDQETLPPSETKNEVWGNIIGNNPRTCHNRLMCGSPAKKINPTEKGKEELKHPFGPEQEGRNKGVKATLKLTRGKPNWRFSNGVVTATKLLKTLVKTTKAKMLSGGFAYQATTLVYLTDKELDNLILCET